MKYFDKNGKEIRAGMQIRDENGEIEKILPCDGQDGNPDLGISASNPSYLAAHPDAWEECYPLYQFMTSE